MKLALLCALLISTFSFAAHSSEIAKGMTGVTMSPIGSTGLSVVGGFTTSGKECEVVVCKEAATVLVDANEYQLSGTLSVFLNQKIIAIQATEDLSVEEAIDLLIGEAQNVLK